MAVKLLYLVQAVGGWSGCVGGWVSGLADKHKVPHWQAFVAAFVLCLLNVTLHARLDRVQRMAQRGSNHTSTNGTCDLGLVLAHVVGSPAHNALQTIRTGPCCLAGGHAM